MTMKKFVFRVNVEVVLTEDDLWPDRDGPEDPTEHHVRQLIKEEGGIVSVLHDWTLESDIDWDVVKLG
jgi:hypothetical protein